MSKRKPYTVTFPARESRDALNLRVSSITNLIRRGDEPKVLMMTERAAANLLRDGWGIEVAADPADAAKVATVEPTVLAADAEPEPEPRPRRSRRREE